jgi:hypothetical protein
LVERTLLFGTWAEELYGVRALNDPQTGWLARREAIRASVDGPHVHLAAGELTLGELMSRFLTHKREKATAGERSKTMLGDYLVEVAALVRFFKAWTPAGGRRPEHFAAYVRHLVQDRQLGRPARKRVRAYVTAVLRFGAKNGWMTMPNTGTDWAAPATDPESTRQAKARGRQ